MNLIRKEKNNVLPLGSQGLRDYKKEPTHAVLTLKVTWLSKILPSPRKRCFSCAGNFYVYWLSVVTIAFLYNTFAAPMRAAFYGSPIYDPTTTVGGGNWTCSPTDESNVTSGIQLSFLLNSFGDVCRKLYKTAHKFIHILWGNMTVIPT